MAPMYVVKRDGQSQEVKFDAITRRIKNLCDGLDSRFVDPVPVTQKVVEGFYNGISTSEVDTLAAETCAYMSQKHPDFSTLAARIAVSNLHKNTSDSFYETCKILHDYIDKQGRPAALLARDVWEFIQANAEALDQAIDYKRDLGYDYFGFKTLEKSYLLRVHGKIVERPQHMIMRAACGIHMGDLDAALETYDLMSRKFFTHATPTLFNAGTPKPQMSSCFLLKLQDDSIEGIYDTLKQCASISKSAGGIGVAISNVRAGGSYIRGTNGHSNGLVPMLRNFNETARYVDQGGGKRKGSFAMYLEPWHADVFDFLELRKNHGKEEQRARDLFYGLWIPDLFMKRVKDNQDWTLFCPNEAYDEESGKGLMDFWGQEFEELYTRLEREGKGRKTVKAQQLWFRILESQMETGTPYMLYKDHANRKSNQQNLGTIHCSNLCTEIIEYTSKDEVAVCNLASISLPAFASSDGSYDFQRLYEVTKVVTRNLNKVIDRNYYPVVEARKSNLRHRPVGLGVQGLADAFLIMKLPFESEAAKQLNEDIFETIYFAACEASCELAETCGPYETYEGCPASKGLLQFDLWDRKPRSGRWNWEGLKGRIAQFGLRNSLLVAPMPTASTAQILGNNESFEPYTQNLYVRRVLSGEFVQVNRHLLKDLIQRGLWNEELRVQLVAHNGSVQKMDLPQDLKELYKTVWEIRQKVVLDMAGDRGAYIDQSQSLNIHMTDVTTAKLSSMHFHGWQLGLKTGLYYLRTKAAADAIKFTVDVQKLSKTARSDKSLADEPNEPPLPPPAPPPVAPAAPREVVEGHGTLVATGAGSHGTEVPKKESWHHWYAAAQAAEAATMAGTEGITESYTLVEIPDEFTGLLIGKHGSGIKQMQESTGAVLCVGKLAVGGLRKVCVTGCPESQEAAKASLLSFVEQQQEIRKFQEQQVVDYLEVPNKFAGRLIGIKGEVIRQVRDAYGVRAALDDCVDEPMRKLELRGHVQAVQYAKQHVELLLLEVYRRFRIYNAPLESKYNNTSFLFESPLLQTQSAMKQQQDMELLLSPWAAHFAGNLDCVSIFKKFQSLEDAEIPGVDIDV